MGIKVIPRSVGQISGIGQFSVDIDHTEDSITLGDGTNTLTLQDVSGVWAVPVKAIGGDIATSANQTNGSQKTQIVDGGGVVAEIDDVGGEKAIKVSVISSIGGGAAPAETDKSTFTPSVSVFTPIGAVFDDVTPSTLSENETGTLRATANRALHVHIASQAAGASGLTDTELRASAVPVSVSGVSTAANQTTIIGHVDGLEGLLTTIDADTGSIDTKMTTVIGHVDGLEGLLTTIDADTSSIALSVDGVEALLTTIDADTSNLAGILTSLQLLDDIVAGTEAQVDVVTMPAITGSVSIVDALGGDSCMDTVNNALKVSIVASSGGGLTDAELRATAVPVSVAGVATAANQTTIIGHVDGIEGLLTTIDTDTGALAACVDGVSGTELQVDIVTSALPSGASTSANQTTIIGHVDGIEGLLTTIDTDTGAMVTDLAAIEVLLGTIDTDTGAMATSLGALDNALTSVGTDSLDVSLINASVAVTGTFFQATQPVSAASLPLPTGAATSANQTTIIGHVDGIEALLTTIDADTGGILTAVQLIDNAISGSEMQVDIVTMPTATVQGAAAHDAAISGQPVPVGYRAQNANPTLVANGDVSYPAVDLAGRTITTPIAPRELISHQATTITASTTETTVVSATASVFHDLCSLTITNSSATALIVTVRDSTAAGTPFVIALAANGGATINFPTPLKQGAVNTNWTVTCGTSVSSIYVLAQFVTRN